jgi:hypothetical protein
LNLNITEITENILNTWVTDINDVLQTENVSWQVGTPTTYSMYDLYTDKDDSVWGIMKVGQDTAPVLFYLIFRLIAYGSLHFQYIKCQAPNSAVNFDFGTPYQGSFYHTVPSEGQYNPEFENNYTLPNYYMFENLESYTYGNYIVSNIFSGRFGCLASLNNTIPHNAYNSHFYTQVTMPHLSIYNKQSNTFTYWFLYYCSDGRNNSIEWDKIFFFGKYIYTIVKNNYTILNSIHTTDFNNNITEGFYDYFNYGKHYVRRYDINTLSSRDIIFGSTSENSPTYFPETSYSGEMVVRGTVDSAYITTNNKLVFESSGITYSFSEDGSVEYGSTQTQVTYNNPSNIPIGSATSSNSELSGQTSGATHDYMYYSASGTTITLSQNATYTGHTWYMAEEIVLSGYTVGIGDKIEINFKYIQSKPEHDKKWMLYAINGLNQICSNIVYLPFGDYSGAAYQAWLVLTYLADNDLKIVLKIDDTISTGEIQIIDISLLYIDVFKIIYKDFQEKIFYT